MRDCPFCGTERVLKVVDAPVDCPLCKCVLKETVYADETVDVCPRCSGMWLDKGQFEKLTSARSASQDTTVPFAFQKPLMEPPRAYMPCPCCRGLMVRRNFRYISGIIFDWCGEHGAWFDDKELDHVRSFVANGGIDKAQDREITRNADAVGALEAKVRTLETMEKILHKWEMGRIRYRGL